MSAASNFDPHTTTLHETLGLIPGADAVLRRFGLDTCCGGDLPLATAAEHHRVDLGLLLDALRGAGAGDGSSVSGGRKSAPAT